MRLFKEFLLATSQKSPLAFLSSENIHRLSEVNPDKFYVENVRSVLDISTWQARLICETAVRQQLFERWIEVKRPDGTVGHEAPSEADIPDIIEYWFEVDGDYEVKEIETANLARGTFYRLHEG